MSPDCVCLDHRVSQEVDSSCQVWWMALSGNKTLAHSGYGQQTHKHADVALGLHILHVDRTQTCTRSIYKHRKHKRTARTGANTRTHAKWYWITSHKHRHVGFTNEYAHTLILPHYSSSVQTINSGSSTNALKRPKAGRRKHEKRSPSERFHLVRNHHDNSQINATFCTVKRRRHVYQKPITQADTQFNSVRLISDKREPRLCTWRITPAWLGFRGTLTSAQTQRVTWED